MKELSFTLFKNTEFIPLMLVCIPVFFLIRWLFSRRPGKDPVTEPENRLVSFIRPGRSRFPFSHRDRYYVTVVTLLYAIVSFWQLGSTRFPSTTWQPTATSQSFTLVLPEDTHIDAIYAIYGEGDSNSRTQYQLGFNTFIIQGSNNGSDWTQTAVLESGAIYQYKIIEGDWNYRYYRIVSTNISNTLSEIGFKVYEEDRFADVSVYEDSYQSSPYPASLVVDEQDQLTIRPTYYDESYFDEVYHPRNAWEIANGEHMYATVHPLLGTCLIALSIKLFGMNPLAWRLPGALFGVLMVPLFYAILKILFRDEKWCLYGTVMLAADFMHLTTSRIATLEPFSVFFILLMFYWMIRYCQTSFSTTPLSTQLVLLLLSGIAMGLAISTKWTGCYSAVGLAIILFVHFGNQYAESRRAKKALRKTDGRDPVEQEALLKRAAFSFSRTFWITIACCFIFFIFIPIIIYWCVYMFTPVWRDGWSIFNVWAQNVYMYNYHTTLNATHPYQSTWYMWILDIRPIWYYSGTFFKTYQHSISCFSNPFLCWAGLPAILYTVWRMIRHPDNENIIISVGYLTAIGPWVLFVKRCVFAYHFYPTSMFMFMAILYAARDLIRRYPAAEKWFRIFLIAAVVLFIAYLPVTAGFGTSLNYIHSLEWFRTWYFG